jgi:hypothetical protein
VTLTRAFRYQVTRFALAATACWMWTAPVFAQRRGRSSVSELKAERPTMAWFIGFLFIVGTLVVAFKNAKRSHVQ